jgi:hypothetical protein
VTPWEIPICQYIREHSLDRATVSELLTSALDLELGRQDRGAEMRVTGILKQMGWNKSDRRVMLNGIKRWVWLAPKEPTNPPNQPTDQPTDQPDQPFIEVSPEVSPTSNDHISMASDFLDQPAQPFTPTFSESGAKKIEGSSDEENFYASSKESLEIGWSIDEVSPALNDHVSMAAAIAQPLEKLSHQLPQGAISVDSDNAIAPAVANMEESPLKGWHECYQANPYPNPKSDNIQSSHKRSLAIRKAYRAAKTKADLSALRVENGGKYSAKEIMWVSNWLRRSFPAEFSFMQATAKIDQPRLC